MNWKKILFVTLAVAVGYYSYKSPTVNIAPPSYMDDPIWYKAGDDGFILYFVLRDDNGNPTTAKGTLHLAIAYTGIKHEGEFPDGDLLDVTYKVSPSDFTFANVGLGNYKRKTLLYNFGRIKRSMFHDVKGFDQTGMANIIITFTTPDNKEITGITTYKVQ